MTSDAIKQRARLEKQSAGAWDVYGKSASARQAAEVELNRAKRGLDDARKARPAGQATDKDVAAAERRLQEAHAAYELHSEREQGALSAAQAIERDRDALLCAYPAVFAEEAQRATEAAAAALGGAADALRDAQTAWNEAVAVWAPLAHAHGTQGADPWPLPDADQLLADVRRGALVHRPRAWTVTAVTGVTAAAR